MHGAVAEPTTSVLSSSAPLNTDKRQQLGITLGQFTTQLVLNHAGAANTFTNHYSRGTANLDVVALAHHPSSVRDTDDPC